MNAPELIAILKTMPDDLPIICKVSQDVAGYEDFSWMRGEIGKISVEHLYQGSNDEYWDHDRMFDEVNDEPETYGLSADATEEQVEEYIKTHKKETVIAIEVNP